MTRPLKVLPWLGFGFLIIASFVLLVLALGKGNLFKEKIRQAESKVFKTFQSDEIKNLDETDNFHEGAIDRVETQIPTSFQDNTRTASFIMD